MKVPHYNSGYSLIELMIAMFLGLFVLAGIVQTFTSSKKSFFLSNNTALLQEDLRLAANDINKIIRMAGHKAKAWKRDTNTFLVDETFKELGQVLIGFDGEKSSVSDRLILRLEGSGDGKGNPDEDIVDCAGYSVDAEDIAIMELSITSLGVLRCTAINETFGKETSVELVNNIENMQFLYGIDTDNNSYKDEYISATNVTERGLWRNVVSVRLALLVKSEREVLDQKNNKPITLNDITIASKNDRYMRMQSISTIAIRNIVP